MRIDSELFEEAIKVGNEPEQLRRADWRTEFSAFLRSANVPAALQSFLFDFGFDESLWFGAGTFSSIEDIVTENQEFPRIIAAGFLTVGAAGNGDPIVVEMIENPGVTGYLDHEAGIWCTDSEPRQAFLALERSIGAFYHGLAFVDDYPWDYHAGKEYLG